MVILIIVENIYAEPGDMIQCYASSTSSDNLDNTSLGNRFPSKRGRDVNKEWDITKGGATAGTNLWLEKNYNSSRAVDSAEYLDPKKSNISDEDAKCNSFYAIQCGKMNPSLPSEVYYFTPVSDESAINEQSPEMCENITATDEEASHKEATPLVSSDLLKASQPYDGSSDNSGYTDDEYLAPKDSLRKPIRKSRENPYLQPTTSLKGSKIPVRMEDSYLDPKYNSNTSPANHGTHPTTQNKSNISVSRPNVSQYMDMNPHKRDLSKRQLPPLPNEAVTRF